MAVVGGGLGVGIISESSSMDSTVEVTLVSSAKNLFPWVELYSPAIRLVKTYSGNFDPIRIIPAENFEAPALAVVGEGEVDSVIGNSVVIDSVVIDSVAPRQAVHCHVKHVARPDVLCSDNFTRRDTRLWML